MYRVQFIADDPRGDGQARAYPGTPTRSFHCAYHRLMRELVAALKDGGDVREEDPGRWRMEFRGGGHALKTNGVLFVEPLLTNSIFIIRPYLDAGTWVFDDHDRGLFKEALVSGVPEIIHTLCEQEGIRDYGRGFTLLFSAAPFPDAQYRMRRESASAENDGLGQWYRLDNGMRGWLCPALFEFFSYAPDYIYIQLAQREGRPTTGSK